MIVSTYTFSLFRPNLLPHLKSRLTTDSKDKTKTTKGQPVGKMPKKLKMPKFYKNVYWTKYMRIHCANLTFLLGLIFSWSVDLRATKSSLPTSSPFIFLNSKVSSRFLILRDTTSVILASRKFGSKNWIACSNFELKNEFRNFNR